MSTATRTSISSCDTLTARRDPRPVTPVPFHRVVRGELRKSVDTRAGLWLLMVMSLLAVAAMGAMLIWGPTEGHTFSGLLEVAIVPMFLVLPALGVMAATAEWSQRTGLTTFALEPRRGRVLAAKLVAVVILGVVVVAVTMFASAAFVLLRGAFGSAMVWSLPHLSLIAVAGMMVLFVVQGSAFGFALLNTPAAIIAAIVAPTIWTMVVTLIPALRDLGTWTDLNASVAPIASGAATGQEWAHAATATGLWVALPLAIGIYRVLTSEVK